MNRTVILKGVPHLALSLLLAACSQAADDGSASPMPSDVPSQPRSDRPSGQPADPSVAPTEDPSLGPSEEPLETPVPNPDPTVVEHGVHIVARVTGDGVAVRNLPDLQSAIVDGTSHDDDGIVENIRLRAGDEVLVLVGPVYADGFSWYEVVAGPTGPADYFRGWVAGEFIEPLRDEPQFNSIVAIDGQGFPASSTGDVQEFAQLVVVLGVTPMPDEESCTWSLFFVTPDGSRVDIVPEQVVTEAMVGQVAAPNLEELAMDAGGTLLLEATGNCSYAAAVNAPQG